MLKQLSASQGQVGQLSAILKNILYLPSLSEEQVIYFTILRGEVLVRNKQYVDALELSESLCGKQLNEMDLVRNMVVAAQA